MEKWSYLLLGGVIGTACRYVLSGIIYAKTGTDFPYGTLAINLIGCLIIGFLDTLFGEKFLLSPHMRVMTMTGFCGAFTTFSTFILETSHLIKDGENLRALGNIAISVLLGFICLRLGVLLGELI